MGKFKVGDRVVFADRRSNGVYIVSVSKGGWVSLEGDHTHTQYSENVFSHVIEIGTTDPVNSPAHYQSENGIECIDAIRAQLTDDEFRGYIKGNIAKYVWRERTKGGDESLRKAKWYLEYLLKTLSENTAV